MAKCIQFERYEDVRVTYNWTIYENEWNDFMSWMKEAYPAGAEKLKDLTFEEVTAILSDKDAEPITWEQPYFEGDSQTYTQDLQDALREYMRDYAIDAGPVDENYYDDSGDENLTVEDHWE